MNERTKEGLARSFESVLENNPYYEFIGLELDDLGAGWVRARLPYSEAVEAPAFAASGMHGGVINTAVDTVGMGSVLASEGRLVPLVTEDISVTFHDEADDDVLIESTVVSDGATLVTARVEVFPEADRHADDPRLVASGTTTARLFGQSE